MPETTWAAMRPPLLSPIPRPDSATNAAAPVDTSACVRIPAVKSVGSHDAYHHQVGR